MKKRPGVHLSSAAKLSKVWGPPLASTITRFNNWKGSLYFIPVRYGHQIVLADTMRKLKARLASP